MEDSKLSITISAEIKNVSVYGALDGCIKPNVLGGTQSFTYKWSNR
jgi:hypothetical protein